MEKRTVKKVMICCSIFIAVIFMISGMLPSSNPDSTQSVASVQENKVVYLTFDDGPSKNTQALLEILDRYKIKATFFVTAENPAYEELIYEEFKRGNGIGIHTFSHEYSQIYANVDAYIKDMNQMNDVIKKQIGHRVSILRFPGGASNTVSRRYQNGIMKELTQIMEQKGYQYYDWNASNGDGDCTIDQASLVSTAMQEVGEQDKVMMLMHDGGGNEATIQALPKIIETLQQKGYQFRVIDQTTPVFHHHIAN